MIAMLLVAMTPAQDVEQRHHGVHVHGHATGSLAQDGARLTLQLDIPGINLVGFEHAPRDPEQEQALESTLTLLESGDWIQPDPRGACSIVNLQVDAPGFGDPDHSAGHDHGHGHGRRQEHDHKQGHEHEHASFRIQANLNCDRVDRLGWLDLALFEPWPGNERIVLDLLTEQQADRVRLSADTQRVSLRPRR